MPDSELGAALARADAHWKSGRYDAAVRAYSLVAKNFPDSGEATGPALKALLGVGRIGDALQMAANALERGVTTPDILLVTALGRLADQPAVTIAVLDRLVRELPAWNLARIGLFHLAEQQLAALAPDPPFPSSAIEQSYADSAAWIKACSESSPWVAFPVQVLDRALNALRPEGIVAECGVYFGRSLAYIAARTDLAIHGFDSFSGLPEPWLDKPAGAYSTGGFIPQLEGVHLHKGWFDETLPDFAARQKGERIALLHLDCDLYSSTATALRHLGPLCDAETIYVFDDLIGIRGWRDHEFRALEEYAGSRKISVLAAAVTAREVALKIE